MRYRCNIVVDFNRFFMFVHMRIAVRELEMAARIIGYAAVTESLLGELGARKRIA